MTSARLNGTPAASRLERSRVKFSSIRAETFLDPRFKFSPAPAPAGALPSLAALFGAAILGAALSERLIGLSPFSSICRKASCRPPASIWPSATPPED